MGNLTKEQVFARFDTAWKTREQWRDLQEDVFEYCIPNRNIFPRFQPGEHKQDRVFDSTALVASQRFVSRLQNGLTPPFERWFELKAGPAITDQSQRQALNAQLSDVTDMIFHVLESSNFNVVSGECYAELIPGTCAMLILEGDFRQPIHFVSVPTSQLALGEGPNGTIDEIYREWKLKARLVTRTWPDAKVPEDWNDKGKKGDKEITLIEATYWDTKDKNWAYEVLWRGDNQKQQIVTRSYKENPMVVTRWSKVPGEVFGRGPGVLALPDIKTANKVVEMILKNGALAIASPMLVADDGITNPDMIRMAPNAMIRVASTGGNSGASIVPLETSRGFDVGQIILADQRINIKKMLFDNQLPPLEGTVRSATEIIERMRELRDDIGSAFPRIKNEWINPIIKRVVHILDRLGLISLNSDLLNQLFIKVKVVSPLSKKQNLDDVQTTIQWAQILLSLVGPEGLATQAKTEDFGLWFADKLGVDGVLSRSTAERDLKQSEFNQARQAQIEAEGVDKARERTDNVVPLQTAA